ncbi:hypothetical protein N7489_001874 [Penicillium chrysogenum]|uniref:uncharacterized protein n=1 Tax=Penicillium chrysogenum TaxID=5076 RepID=UPI00239EBE8C|nr:uncharacterized protein N7489_001874 [Penicillium chrysogenum]KAJ5251464.1 hypothetical protein N7489_001874 [Penicillium chrysogenum]KAJ5262898.1 hypothetical protein N7524_008203 [Penicillium chrysogenum]
MARKLALLLLLIHSTQVLALPTPPETPVASKSLASANTRSKRYYFPETIPDQDEVAAMLKETAMREAGFVPSSIGSPSKSVPESKDKTETELRISLPDPHAAIGTDAPANPLPDSYTHQDTKLSQAQSQSGLKESVVVALGSDMYPIHWPPFVFFVISAAIVCFFTVLRGIRAKK